MTPSKKLFFRFCTPLAALMPLPALRKMSGRRLLIPLYHAVSDAPAPHLKYLYQVKTTDQFEADLEVLLANYKPISLRELLEITQGGRPPDEPVFHLTFDDGLSSFYEVVAPILKKKGVSATCFLNNQFIDNKDMLFRLKVSLLIDHLHQSKVGSQAWTAFHDWVKKHELGNSYYRKLLLSMKFNDLSKIEELARGLGVDFTKWLRKEQPYMTTAQIFELIGEGFSFGAHSHEHVDFRELSEEGQVQEVKTSCEGISKAFGLNYKVFSFPFTDFGVKPAFFDKLKVTGAAQLSFGCAGIKEDVVPENLQRIPVEEYPLNLNTALKKEYMYHAMLRLTRKEKMKR